MRKHKAPKYFIELQQQCHAEYGKAFALANLERFTADYFNASDGERGTWDRAFKALGEAQPDILKPRWERIEDILSLGNAYSTLAWKRYRVENPKCKGYSTLKYIPNDGTIIYIGKVAAILNSLKGMAGEMTEKFKDMLGIGAGDE